MVTRALFAGVHGVAALALLCALRFGDRAERTESAQATTTAEAPSASSDLALANRGLERLRKGDDAVLPELRACADRCALLHDRPDVREIVEFFARLPVAERARGLEFEARWSAIRQEVYRQRPLEIESAEWSTRRPAMLAALEEIASSARSAPDFSPAARALSLHATILRQRIVEDSEFDEAAKREWIETGRREAREAIEMFGRVGMQTPQLEARIALAWFDWASGDWNSAQDGFEDVLGLARRVSHREFEVRALNGLARISEESGDPQEMSRILDEIARVESPADSWNLALRHGRYLLEIDEPTRAAEFLVRNRPKLEQNERDWHVLMASVLARKGDVEGAAAHERALRQPNQDANGAARALTELSLAEANLSAGRAADVLQALDKLSWDTSIPAIHRADCARLRGSALLALGRSAEAAEAFEDGLEIGDSIEDKLSDVGLTTSVLGESVGLEMLALLARARLDVGDALGAARDIEDRQLRSLRGKIALGAPPAILADSIRAWSNAYELGFLTWVIGGDSSVVVHVNRSGSARGAVLKLGRKQIEEAVRRVREATIANDVETVASFGAEIQAAILPAEILEHVTTDRSSDRPRLLICAHGPLEWMPLDVMPLFADGSPLTVVPVVLPGILEPTPGKALESLRDLEWSLVGDPLDSKGTLGLPGVHAELEALASLHLGSHSRVGAAFDRGAVLEALASGRPFHIATHLVSGPVHAPSIDARLARAGFLLSSGERFDTGAIAAARPRLPIAVLSACETGSGQFVDGQASIGVARAFLESGTRNLLVTTWPVADDAARRFTLAFHHAIRDGQVPSRAAASARDALRNAGASTADWAAFRLVGRD